MTQSADMGGRYEDDVARVERLKWQRMIAAVDRVLKSRPASHNGTGP
jgi:hypothetical protein